MKLSDEQLRQKFANATPEEAAKMICRAAARARAQEDPDDDAGEDQTPHPPKPEDTSKRRKVYDSAGNLLGTCSEDDIDAADEDDDQETKTKAFAAAVIRAGQKRRGEIA